MHPTDKRLERLKGEWIDLFVLGRTVVYETEETTETAITKEKEYSVLLYSVIENSKISTRAISRQHDISQTSTLKIVHKYKTHHSHIYISSHIPLHQELDLTDDG